MISQTTEKHSRSANEHTCRLPGALGKTCKERQRDCEQSKKGSRRWKRKGHVLIASCSLLSRRLQLRFSIDRWPSGSSCVNARRIPEHTKATSISSRWECVGVNPHLRCNPRRSYDCLSEDYCWTESRRRDRNILLAKISAGWSKCAKPGPP